MTFRSSIWAGSCLKLKGVAGGAAQGRATPSRPGDETGSDPGGAGGAVLACLSSLAWRVSLAVAEEAARRLACLARDLAPLRLLDRFRPELRRHHLLKLELLLGGEREKLVRGLLRLKRAFRALAARDDVGERLRVAPYVVDDAVLDPHRLAKRGHCGIEWIACASRTLIAAEPLIELLRVELAEALVELIDAEVDALRLAHELVDLLEALAKLLKLREIDPGEGFALVDQHLRFVLEALDLVIDRGERARGGEQVLRIVRWIEHAELGRDGRRGQRDADTERADGAERESGEARIFADRDTGHGKLLLVFWGAGGRVTPKQVGRPIEAGLGEKGRGEVGLALFGQHRVYALLAVGIGCAAQRQRDRA